MGTDMNAAASVPLVDIQNLVDSRDIAIDKVGVRRVKHPLHVRAREGGVQHSVGEFSLTVDLPREFKGTHMSRFLEVLGERAHDVSAETIPAILAELRTRLNARTAHLEVRFTLFREKAAPVTGKTGMMGYEVGFDAQGGDGQGGVDGASDRFLLNLVVPVATLCPCSREISAYGAHNQRGYVTVQVEPDPAYNGGFLWLEDVIDLIEAAGSAPLFPVLKRPDEKWVTERAYDTPRFVEDLVREVALAFDAHPGIRAYTIEVENHESIHDHNAYAYLARTKGSTGGTVERETL